MSLTIVVDDAPLSLKMPSTTLNSVEVVSIPQKADQSLTTMPAPITSLPLFTVPDIVYIDDDMMMDGSDNI